MIRSPLPPCALFQMLDAFTCEHDLALYKLDPKQPNLEVLLKLTPGCGEVSGWVSRRTGSSLTRLPPDNSLLDRSLP